MERQSLSAARPVYVALARGLESCAAVLTLGLRESIGAYSAEERDLLREARVVFFPSIRFVDVLEATGKRTFPSPSTYRFQRSRLQQELLIRYLGIPHPRTRFYYGSRQKRHILEGFEYPFLAMGPGHVSSPPRIVRNADDLGMACRGFNPVVIQEIPAWDDRLRLICVGDACAGALRLCGGGNEEAGWEPVDIETMRTGDARATRLSGGSDTAAGSPGVHGHTGSRKGAAGRGRAEAAVFRSTHDLMKTAGLDDMVFEWSRAGTCWYLVRMERPPSTWLTPAGRVHHGRHLCKLIQSGAFS